MDKILRVVMPQWQGGNRPQYYIGSKLLEWLAPETTDETIEISINRETTENSEKDGIVAKDTLLSQSKDALDRIKEKNPDKIVVLGGDCSVELAPFAYLLDKYSENTAILWIDSHLDIMVPEEWKNYHAMVLTSLLGDGDKDFSNLVKTKVKPENVIYAGINEIKEFDRELYRKYRFVNFDKMIIEKSSERIIEEFKKKNIKNIIVHFDLDVLSLNEFRSQYFAEIPIYDDSRKKFKEGTSVSAIVKLINQINDNFNMVGLGITEHLQWDIIVIKEMLEKLPLLRILT